MGIGPKVECYRCGKTYFGGKGYERGIRNFCYDCLVLKVNEISSDEFDKLGGTQKGFINMIHEMGGLTAAGGKDFWLSFLKENAGEIEGAPLNNENKAEEVNTKLEGSWLTHLFWMIPFIIIELIVISFTITYAVAYGWGAIVIGCVISLPIGGCLISLIDQMIDRLKEQKKVITAIYQCFTILKSCFDIALIAIPQVLAPFSF